MSGLLAFFSPMPKEAQRKQRPASSPAAHARFPEPKEARNLKRKGSTLQLPAVTEKKKDNRGGAGRGQGRKKGSLGKRKKEAQQKEKLAAGAKKSAAAGTKSLDTESFGADQCSKEAAIASELMVAQAEVTAKATAAALLPILDELRLKLSKQGREISVLKSKEKSAAEVTVKQAETERCIITLSHGNRACFVCSKHTKGSLLLSWTQRQSPWLEENGGVPGEGAAYRYAKRSHFASGIDGGPCKMHLVCLEMERNTRLDLIPKAIASMEQERVDQLIRLFKIVNFIAKRNHSFLEYEKRR